MSTALLDKLKIKPIPQVREQVAITIQVPTKKAEVVVKTAITDKTKTSGFDRALFFSNLAKNKGEPKIPTNVEETPSEPAQKPPPKIKKPTGKIKLNVIETAEVPVPAEAPATAKASAPLVPAPAKRLTKPPVGVIETIPEKMVKIGDEVLANRLGKQDKDKQVVVGASSYYLSNRKIFIDFMSSLFDKYKKEIGIEALQEASCTRSEEFSLMTHQKIVRDYLSLYTPYRGLLLYHGLGSGKTCTSIAIAEGLKTRNQIIVMTPASLRTNYIEELKKCGDSLYRKNQYWEFINSNKNEDLIKELSLILSLSVEFIKRNGGAWLINVKKSANFETFTSQQKDSIDKQLDEMIRYKYKFISYNGLRKTHLTKLTEGATINPFDNKVVIIDEAHNFVSRIVNKLGKKKDDSVFMQLYNYLMNAQNLRIVLLTGTPIINYPNELGILFNILRGKIKTWHFKLSVDETKKINQDYLQTLFKKNGNLMDYLEYKPTSNILTITRNPLGFINVVKNDNTKYDTNKYEGVELDERGNIDDDKFIKFIKNTLEQNGIKIQPRGVKLEGYKAMPDTLDDFKKYFIDDKTNEVKNMTMFKRRILGLTSYFRSAQEGLMPKYDKKTDFVVIKIPMSPHQFTKYEEARKAERKVEKNNAMKRGKKKGDELFQDESSTYRIFSRLFCNFVFPYPVINRPMPSGDENLENAILTENNDEDDIDLTTDEDKLANANGKYDADEIYATEQEQALAGPEGALTEGALTEGALTEGALTEGAPAVKLSKKEKNSLYDKAVTLALQKLDTNKDKYLTPEALQIYSPKFLNILENIKDESHVGLHLVYSQFRTLEGIGILKLILEANGFTQFKLVKEGDKWKIGISEEDKDKPTFALYTGTESTEEKEIVRNIFNGNWKLLSPEISSVLQAKANNNMYGEIIKVFMITASGAEGISLENVRYVHITEPYWHPVRIEQVIGRARRICSHQNLPEELRTITVFMYLMTLSEEQKKSNDAVELRIKDKSKRDNTTPITTDEALYEIATIKEEVSAQLLLSVKESSIDCAIHSKFGAKEKLQCFSFGPTDSDKFAYTPSIKEEEDDSVAEKNKGVATLKGTPVTLEGTKYFLNDENNFIYDFDSVLRGNPVHLGKLKFIGTGKNKTVEFEKL
jgi:hypothetical protein